MRLKVKPSRSSAAPRSRSARRKRLRDELEGKLRNRKLVFGKHFLEPFDLIRNS